MLHPQSSDNFKFRRRGRRGHPLTAQPVSYFYHKKIYQRMHALNFHNPPSSYQLINLNSNDNGYRYYSYVYPFFCGKRFSSENPLQGWDVQHRELGKKGCNHAVEQKGVAEGVDSED